MAKRTDPAWRDEAAAHLLVRHLPSLDLNGPILVMGESHPTLMEALGSGKAPFETWSRRCRGPVPGTPWPPPGPFGSALIRIPRSRDELVMTLHAAAAVVEPTGTMIVFGANDEGIKSASGPMEDISTVTDTVATGGRCRLLAGRGVRAQAAARGREGLEAFKEVGSLVPSPLPPQWVSYPGVFAQGRLDSGTRLLLSCLPAFPDEGMILDYGCGSGVVGWHVLQGSPGCRMHLLDNDAVAVEAAKENVPSGEVLLRDGLPTGEGHVYDVIVSNPPFHRGKAEDPEMLSHLVAGAGEVLTRNGDLIFVTQRRMPMQSPLERHFRTVDLLCEDTTFRVWRGSVPQRGKP